MSKLIQKYSAHFCTVSVGFSIGYPNWSLGDAQILQIFLVPYRGKDPQTTLTLMNLAWGVHRSSN